MQLTRRRERPVGELSDKTLRQRIVAARKVIDALPDSPPHTEMATHLAVAEAAARDRQAAEAELARRRAAQKQAEKDAALAPFRRGQLLGKRSLQARALDAVARCADPELHGETLTAARLSEAEGKELLALARRRLDGETPDAAETERFEALAGRAAGDEGLFERRRAEQAETEKLEALQAAERRLPMADSLVAACMAEDDLFDGLRRKLRPHALVVDEYGRQVPGAVADRIYDLDNIAALFVIVSLVGENGGREIHVGEHGVLSDGLPSLPTGSLAQLRRNGWLSVTQEGGGTRVGLGERCRAIAAKWNIDLPPIDGDTSG